MTEVYLNATQFDLLMSALIVCSSAIAWCLGFLAHEMGGK